jgi:pyruvate dehydrogenase E2 component (dihydrolipoamide acetyltransferase)
MKHNIDLTPYTKISPFRKVAIGTWQTAYDPSVYGTLRIRMDKSLEYIEYFRQKYGKRLTLTHLVAKAIAMALAKCPDANGILRFNRIYLRKSVDIFFQVAMTDEKTGKIDLSGLKINEMEKKSLVEIIDEMEKKAKLVRAKQDPTLENTRQTMKKVPYFAINPLLKAISFLSYGLNLDLHALGIPKDPFGSVMVTNVGSLNLDLAYVPLVPYSRVPILIAPGTAYDAAVVEDGKIVPGKMIDISATFDHRFVDGVHASIMAKTTRDMLGDPFAQFGPFEAPAGSTSPAPTK